jgi:tryptophan halogenase
MKITVLGRGNAGCLTALHYYYYGKLNNLNLEIELIHDSKIPTLTVGQATIPHLPHFIWESLGINFYNSKQTIKSTIKSGILYENWGKINDNFFHGFPLGTYALHYDTQEIQNYILQKGLFNVKISDEHIIDYNKIDSDYIFDCRGYPKNYENYESLINPLNAVVCSNIDKVESDTHWTRAVATPDGWCFYIPLHNTVSLGYMYNSNITTKETAINNFKNIFKIEDIREEFPFKQYIAKQPIIDDRIILNGNMLFFLEPLESTSVATYDQWNRFTWDWIIEKKITSNQACTLIKEYTQKIQNFILYHYAFGSKYDTPFWSFAKNMTNCIKDKEFYNILEYSKNHSDFSIRNIDYMDNGNIYGQWKPWNIKFWYDSMTKKV